MERGQADTPAVGWFVDRPRDVDDDAIGDYLARGTWVSPHPTDHAGLLADMRVAESVALKTVKNQTVGLPFFNADRPVSTMTIFATGRVRTVDAATGTIGIDWDPLASPRQWYFWTGLRALWRVEANPETASVQLLDFAFNGVEQDWQRYLAEPFWRDRYPPQPGFSWIPFYAELASRLADFRDDRAPLVEALQGLAQSEPLLGYLTKDSYADGSTGPLADLDPFTVLGTFNRGLTDENRRRLAAAIGERLGIEAPTPADFDGIPLINNQKAWFFRFEKNRGPDDIDRLWAVFTAGLAFAADDSAETRARLIAAYDAARALHGVKWNLSLGLFWARPERFATLEGRSRPFIKAHFGIKAPEDGAGYLALLDSLRKGFTSGKTFIALALDRHIAGAEQVSHHQLVQFHPSYAYEDFFEGYRPAQTTSGQPTFQIVPGPLRRIAAEAKAKPDQPFVLIIDELNRANLAKVFGELYFLLEYRDRGIRLQYNPAEVFVLPPNLFFIGTMNTADRSIALLDAAMRRRFAFVELHPEEPPVRDVLARYLDANDLANDPRARLLAALNAAIDDADRDFKIGPSYLMRPEAETEAGLARIWRQDILPLLEEHYYGRLNRAELTERFGLAALRRQLGREQETSAEEAGAETDLSDFEPGKRSSSAD